MKQHCKKCHRKKTAIEDSFFAAVGRAAEKEMLDECAIWEQETGELRIPINTESQILALAGRQGIKHLSVQYVTAR